MRPMILRFLRDESGVTAIEYTLIAALIAVASITAFTNVGASLVAKLGTINAAL